MDARSSDRPFWVPASATFMCHSLCRPAAALARRVARPFPLAGIPKFRAAGLVIFLPLTSVEFLALERLRDDRPGAVVQPFLRPRSILRRRMASGPL
jgi:hypothetical protein